MTTFDELEPLEIFSGVFALIFVLTSLFIGLLFLKKYFKTKRKEQLSLGLTWVLLSSGWWGSAFTFLSIMTFEYAFKEFEYLFLNNVFFVLSILFWIYSFVHIFYQKKEKVVIVLTSIIIGATEVVLISLLLIDPFLVGRLNGYFITDSGIFLLILNILIPVVAFILGVFFSVMSIKHEDPKIRKRGIILLIAFSSLLIGGIGIVILSDDIVLLSVSRVLLLSSAIEYYVAFFIGH
ncbi:MAG: hypothetical protein ACFFAS_09910 [Promethearchaeota archaeon]